MRRIGTGLHASAAVPRRRRPGRPNGAADPPDPLDPILRWYDLTAQVTHVAGHRMAPATSVAEASRIWAVGWLAARRALHDARRGRAATAAVVSALHDVLVTLVPEAAPDLGPWPAAWRPAGWRPRTSSRTAATTGRTRRPGGRT